MSTGMRTSTAVVSSFLITIFLPHSFFISTTYQAPNQKGTARWRVQTCEQDGEKISSTLSLLTDINRISQVPYWQAGIWHWGIAMAARVKKRADAATNRESDKII